MKHHIVAIGISKHNNSDVDLEYAGQDATEFYTLFKQNIDSVGYNRLLVDQEATLSEIKTALGEELLKNVKEDDAFFFFYSGHGSLAKDHNKPDLLTSYLVPYDATRDIPNSCLSFDNIKTVVESLSSKANLVFVDSCFSGTLSKHGKAYPRANSKNPKNIKSFSNTVIGNGSVIFTASKDTEESIEDPELKNGLFTYILLEELQKKREKSFFPIIEIFSPIADRVSERAKKKWGVIQTPTLLGKLEGDLKIPVFEKRLSLRPDTIEIPNTSKSQNTPFSSPLINLSTDKKTKLIEDTIEFVVNNSLSPNSKIGEINLERLCDNLFQKIKTSWENILQETENNIEKIPAAISKLEASSYQFMILGGAVTAFGNQKQVHIVAEYIANILQLGRNQPGLIALMEVPEVIVIEMIYTISVIAISKNNLKPLETLLNYEFDDLENISQPPTTLLKNYHYHYTQALTGHSNKINDYVRDFLKNQDWLSEISPRLKEKTDDYQLQANFLLVILSRNLGIELWPDFGRFYESRIIPFAKKILYDAKIREQLGNIINTTEDKVRQKIIGLMNDIVDRGLGGGFWWNSITRSFFMTKEEKEAEGIKD